MLSLCSLAAPSLALPYVELENTELWEDTWLTLLCGKTSWQ